MHKIVHYPHECLTKPTRPVTHLSKDVLSLLDEMLVIMESENGVGLAANQLGESIRMAVVKMDDETGLFEMLNPKIVSKSKTTTLEVEGCLSFPGVYGTVERAAEVTVRYVDRDGYEIEVDVTDDLARIMQHEIDHLDGLIFTDKFIEQVSEEEFERLGEEE